MGDTEIIVGRPQRDGRCWARPGNVECGRLQRAGTYLCCAKHEAYELAAKKMAAGIRNGTIIPKARRKR